MTTPKQLVERMLAPVGITIDGDDPWDPQVHDDRLYSRVLAEGTLGIGEAYMDGWWSCDEVDECVARIMRDRVHENLRVPLKALPTILKAYVLNMQNKKRASHSAKHHYDIGDDLYEAMLDKTMTYSCGYWRDANTLLQAQRAKYDLICRKLGIKDGMSVLDIGCGWGGFAEYVANRYDVRVYGVTLSHNQAVHARKRTEGLNVRITLQDYRDITFRFDRIVSIGMFEHVGAKNYDTFFSAVKSYLTDDGLALLHTIGNMSTSAFTDPWIERYIFPGGNIPSAEQITEAIGDSLVIEDWHSFGADYDTTLMAWNKNFQKAWPDLSQTYDERFKRMWEYYLLSCAGSFRGRFNQVWQIVLSHDGVIGGYRSVR